MIDLRGEGYMAQEPWYVEQEREREEREAEIRRRAERAVRTLYTLAGASEQTVEDLTQIHMQIEREAMEQEVNPYATSAPCGRRDKPFSREEFDAVLFNLEDTQVEIVSADFARTVARRARATIEEGYRMPRMTEDGLTEEMHLRMDDEYPTVDNMWVMLDGLGYALTMSTQPGATEVHLTVATRGDDVRTYNFPHYRAATLGMAAIAYQALHGGSTEYDVDHFLDPYLWAS